MTARRFTGRTVILRYSICLLRTDDPHIGEKVAFSNVPKEGPDQKRKLFPIDKLI